MVEVVVFDLAPIAHQEDQGAALAGLGDVLELGLVEANGIETPAEEEAVKGIEFSQHPGGVEVSLGVEPLFEALGPLFLGPKVGPAE